MNCEKFSPTFSVFTNILGLGLYFCTTYLPKSLIPQVPHIQIPQVSMNFSERGMRSVPSKAITKRTDRAAAGVGPGAQHPENFEVFVHYIPQKSTFGTREQFLDQFFDNLKICIFVSV